LIPALAAALHLLAAGLSLLFYARRATALRGAHADEKRLADTLAADGWCGLIAIAVYAAGLWRLFGGLEKPTDWYTSHPLFWVKMGIIGALTLIELPVQWVLLPLQIAKSRKKPVVLTQAKAALARRFNLAGVALTCAIIPVAAFMARGVGRAAPTVSDAGGPACAVLRVFETKCIACHAASNRLGGLDLQTDPHGALVEKLSAQWASEKRVVPGAPERSLLYTKLSGTQPADRGARMPLTGPLDQATIDLFAQWIREGAPRCAP
jgi:putative membrane protein